MTLEIATPPLILGPAEKCLAPCVWCAKQEVVMGPTSQSDAWECEEEKEAAKVPEPLDCRSMDHVLLGSTKSNWRGPRAERGEAQDAEKSYNLLEWRSLRTVHAT